MLRGRIWAIVPPGVLNAPRMSLTCTRSSLIAPLNFPEGYDQFLTGPTLDPTYGTNGCVIFGTFDGRVISLDMSDGINHLGKDPLQRSGRTQ